MAPTVQTKDMRVNRIVKTRGVGAVPAFTLVPGAGLQIKWPSDGVVLYMFGTVRAPADANGYAAGMNSLGFALEMGTGESLITNGDSRDYAIMGELFPTAGFRFSLGVRVKQTEVWFAYFVNYAAAVAYTPSLGFGVYEFNSRAGY